MTYTQFLRRLARKAKKYSTRKRGAFTFQGNEMVRTCKGYRCPIEFVAGVGEGQWERGAKLLGLTRQAKHRIVRAADSRQVKVKGTYDEFRRTPGRKSLLRAVNLTNEPTIDNNTTHSYL